MPISPDADYCLQGAVECLDITADIYHGAFIAPLDVNAIVDASDARRYSFADAVERDFLAWYQDAAENKQAYVTVHGAVDYADQMREARQTVINTLARVELRDCGVIEQSRLGPDVPLPDVHIGDTIANAIDETIRFHGLDRWASKLRNQMDRAGDFLSGRNPAEVFALAETARVDYNTRIQHLTDRLRNQIDSVDAAIRRLEVRVETRTGTKVPRIGKRERRRVRRAINRGIRSVIRYVGPEVLRDFISQGRAVVHGCRYDYRLKRSLNIQFHTRHLTPGIPFQMLLTTKAGDVLASGCAYVPRTPVLDQLLALILNVGDPESEVELIRKCNWSGRTEAWHNDAFLRETFNRPTANQDNVIDLDEVIPAGSLNEVIREDDAYHAAYSELRRQFAVYSDVIDRHIANLTGVPLISPPDLREWRRA